MFKEALEPFGREVRLNLSRTYSVREYCTQYKESDWNFVQRLMADEGITLPSPHWRRSSSAQPRRHPRNFDRAPRAMLQMRELDLAHLKQASYHSSGEAATPR